MIIPLRMKFVLSNIIEASTGTRCVRDNFLLTTDHTWYPSNRKN